MIIQCYKQFYDSFQTHMLTSMKTLICYERSKDKNGGIAMINN